MHRYEEVEAAATMLCEVPPHQDPLFRRQIAEGMHTCFCNSVSLLEDARLLAKHDRLGRALSLSILAMEELAKVSLVCDAAGLGGDVACWKRFWQQLGRHTVKQEKLAEYGSI